jgi:hypothetical protein
MDIFDVKVLLITFGPGTPLEVEVMTNEDLRYYNWGCPSFVRGVLETVTAGRIYDDSDPDAYRGEADFVFYLPPGRPKVGEPLLQDTLTQCERGNDLLTHEKQSQILCIEDGRPICPACGEPLCAAVESYTSGIVPYWAGRDSEVGCYGGFYADPDDGSTGESDLTSLYCSCGWDVDPRTTDLVVYEWFTPGAPVISRDGKTVGELTGSRHACRLEGCTGLRLGVRWPKEPGQKRRRVTFPCTKGMRWSGRGWQIL